MALVQAMRVVLAGTLVLSALAAARAQQTNKDPNFPNGQGNVALVPNGDKATNIEWYYGNGVAEGVPVVKVSYFSYGATVRLMTYLGYNEEGSWLRGQDSRNQSVTYTIKGNTLTRQHADVQLPVNLKNGSNTYLAYIGGSGKAEDNTTQAQEGNTAPVRDPNFPNGQGSIKFAPNSANANYLTYEYHFGPDNPPSIDVAFRGVPQAVTYYGYDSSNTSWLGGPGALFTIKGNFITQMPRTARLPKDLRNGSPAYYAGIGGSKSEDNIAPPATASPPGRPESGSPPAAVRIPASSRPAAPGSTAGTDVRIERGASGTTLRYKDASGEHSYKVRRPATATAGVDNVDTGGWIYVAPDGKSGFLFNVSANHSVVVMPLAQPMLGMLAGHGAN